MSLPRLRLGESSVPLAAPILLQDIQANNSPQYVGCPSPAATPFPAGPKASGAFLTTAASRLVSDWDIRIAAHRNSIQSFLEAECVLLFSIGFPSPLAAHSSVKIAAQIHR